MTCYRALPVAMLVSLLRERLKTTVKDLPIMFLWQLSKDCRFSKKVRIELHFLRLHVQVLRLPYQIVRKFFQLFLLLRFFQRAGPQLRCLRFLEACGEISAAAGRKDCGVELVLYIPGISSNGSL